MFTARNIHYDVADRTRGLDIGGIGAIHTLARRIGLTSSIDEGVDLLKKHLPYHESDHVLNIAYNILAGGTCLQDIELRRNNEVYMDALGAQRIPDPTTAGDFCRRFAPTDVEALIDVLNEVRLRVWKQQPEAFFEEATLDVDSTLVPTTGECKGGMDISHKGQWGYHPLIVSLANTQEPLILVNRSGNEPSQQGGAQRLDEAIDLCIRAGFRSIKLRGDTAFSQTRHLDRWDDRGVQFVFGFPAGGRVVDAAEALPESAWLPLPRRAKRAVKTERRARPARVKEQIVQQRGFENIRLQSEHVAEFQYQPRACEKPYRMIALRKNLTIEKGESALIDEILYFFYITNDCVSSPAEVVREANGRCHQENLIEQLKNGVRALRMPVDNLVSNWAYMVMASLAWSLKAWFALLLPETGRWRKKYKEEKTAVLRMEFKTFLDFFMRMPAQLVRTGRTIIYRLLAWNRYQHVFLRAVDTLAHPLRC